MALKEKYQKTVLPVIADVRNLSSVENGVRQAIEHFGDIDIAIHNACLCTFESEHDTGYEVYQNVMDVNYFGALRLAKTVLPYMRKARKGRIIFTSSGVGVTGFSNISPYAASKGAIESLAKCLEIENEEYGISFHLFHPPLTNTKSASGISIPKEFKAEAKKVGYGLADHIWSKKFVICHSASQAAQMRLCYLHPLYIGKMMSKAAKRAAGLEKTE
ncbi:MAG: SDR family NAD(P)-dependent oxidoreductase [Lachnospiraceae bacterium]|nr:SDR family NAD(P)-dependent oxidoreductase [Lachnospiraceae bacterium]